MEKKNGRGKGEEGCKKRRKKFRVKKCR